MRQFIFLTVFLALSSISAANTPPALSTPNAASEAHLGSEFFGNLSGAANVGSGGNASYIIPLELPPGTHSMAPKLSLNYHSDVKNGLVGVGWFVEGLTSKINRCPQTIAQDGQSKGIDLSNDDRFCMDGHRLVPISGAYGAVGTEYRTESDEFSRITSVGGSAGNPDYWTVERKDGVTLTFGESTDAKMQAPGTTSHVVWCLEKVEDELGNYFSYSFDRPTTITTAADSYLRPARIDYTANDSQSLSAYASVQFEYEARDDEQTKYSLNGPITTDKRLSNIKTYVGATLVKDYQLTYEYSTSTQQSRLTELKTCSNLGDCTETSGFDWSNDGIFFDDSYNPATSYQYQTLGSGDFNGDGLADLLLSAGGFLIVKLKNPSGGFNTEQFSNGTGIDFSTNSTDLAFIVGDFNGDARDDFIACVPQNEFCYLHLWDDINGLKYSDQQIDEINSIDIWDGFELKAGDLNKDGRTDLILRKDINFVGNIRTYLADANGNFTIEHQNYSSSYFSSSNFLHVTDFNGDGHVDLLSQDDWAQHAQFFADENGVLGAANTFSAGLNADDESEMSRYFTLGDFNGDGRPDLLTFNEAGSQYKYSLYHSDEEGQFNWVSTIGHSELFSSMPLHQPTATDLNGDGRADLFFQRAANQGTSAWYALSEPDGTFSSATVQEIKQNDLDIYWNTFPLGGTMPVGTSILSGDFNGDGRSDLFSNSGKKFWNGNYIESFVVSSQSNEDFPDQLIAVTDGLGNETTFEYKPLTDSTVYTKGTGAVYPEQDSISSRYVVSELRQSNGIGGESVVSYTYEGARTNVEGRGDLGFAKMTAVNAAQNRTTITEYKQGFPYSKFPEKVEVRRTSDNQLLSSTETTYGGHVDPIAGTIFPYVADRTEKVYEPLSGTLLSTTLTTNHCDAYGNITDTTKLVTDHSNSSSFESKTISTFNIDTTNWRVGQKLSETQENKLDSVNNASLNLTTSFTYNANGQLASSTRGSGLGNSIELTTTYAYDGFGNITSETISGPGITSRTGSTAWDSRGQFPTTVTNALGHSETRVHDDRFGVITSQTGANGLTTTWQYNDFGQLTLESRPDGSSTATARHLDSSGSLSYSSYYIEVLTSGSPPSRTFYDSLGRERRTRSQSFDGSYVHRDTEYDSRGRTKRTSEPYFASLSPDWNTPTYDDSNRVTAMTAADTKKNSSSSYTGYSVTVTDAGGRTVTSKSNAIGQVIETIDDLGTSSEFTYNQNGQRTSVINASGTALQSTVTYTLDILGRVLVQDDPDHGSYTYTYDALSQKLTEITPKMAAASQSMSFAYDLLGRMTSRTEPEGTTTWTYDNNVGGNLGIGKLHSESMSGYSRTYTYASHGDGRPTALTTVIGTNTYVSETSYDSIGRIDTTTYPSSTSYTTGLEVENTYNSLGFLERVQNANTTDVYYQFMDSDAAGRMTEQWLGDGSTVNHTYEAHSARLTSQDSDRNGTAIQHFNYAWDSTGNMSSRTDVVHGMTESFTYDDLDRLTSAQVGTATLHDFGFDIIGNITDKTGVGDYSYNLTQPHAVGQIVDGGTTNDYNYDANGNLGTGDDLPTSTWASYNKPTQIAQGSNSYQFEYGTDRARYKKTHITASATTTTHYLGDMEVVYGTTTEYRHLIRAAGTVIAVLKDTGTTATDYLHRDHLGSLTAITDTTGTVQERLAYDAWGQRRDATDWDGAATATEIRGFTGHEHLDDVGIIHMNGRVYSPKLGKFLSPDPVTQAPENGQNYNRYSYVYNNPLKYTDPSGYQGIPLCNYDYVCTSPSPWTVTAIFPSPFAVETPGFADAMRARVANDVLNCANGGSSSNCWAYEQSGGYGTVLRNLGADVPANITPDATPVPIVEVARARPIRTIGSISSEGEASLQQYNLGLRVLARVLNGIGDQNLIDIYNQAEFSYVDRIREDGAQMIGDRVVSGTGTVVLASADFENQRILFYRAPSDLSRADFRVTVFHEFRHLQQENFDLRTNRDGILGDRAPFEQDAQQWALDIYGLSRQ